MGARAGVAKAGCCIALALTSACFSSNVSTASDELGGGASAHGSAGEPGDGDQRGTGGAGGVGGDGIQVGQGGAPGAGTASSDPMASLSQCLEVFEHASAECASCMCQGDELADGRGGCQAEVLGCLANPDPEFARLCADLVSCRHATGCVGALCYTPDACIAELDAATADYGGFPSGCIDFEPDGAPCNAASEIFFCRDERSACADLCNPPHETPTIDVPPGADPECFELYTDTNRECAACLCQADDPEPGVGGCQEKILSCMSDAGSPWSIACTALADCMRVKGCSGANCYAPDACMAELDEATADYGGFPNGCTDLMPGESPCTTATEIFVCRDESSSCLDVCTLP